MRETCPLCGLPVIFGSLQGCLCSSIILRAEIRRLKSEIAGLRADAILNRH